MAARIFDAIGACAGREAADRARTADTNVATIRTIRIRILAPGIDAPVGNRAAFSHSASLGSITRQSRSDAAHNVRSGPGVGPDDAVCQSTTRSSAARGARTPHDRTIVDA